MSESAPTTFCVNHPTVETSLRCNRCEKPICTRCAVLTPTGYRCRECVRGQQRTFDTAQWWDYPAGILTAVVLGFVGSLIVPRLGFFTIFLAPVFAVAIAEIVRVLIRKRRSDRLFKWVTAAAVVGSLPYVLIGVFGLVLGGGVGGLLGLVWQGFYTFTLGSTLYYRLRGIRIG